MDTAFYLALGLMIAGYVISIIADKTIKHALVYKIIDIFSAGLFIGGVGILLLIAFFAVILKNGF